MSTAVRTREAWDCNSKESPCDYPKVALVGIVLCAMVIGSSFGEYPVSIVEHNPAAPMWKTPVSDLIPRHDFSREEDSEASLRGGERLLSSFGDGINLGELAQIERVFGGDVYRVLLSIVMSYYCLPCFSLLLFFHYTEAQNSNLCCLRNNGSHCVSFASESLCLHPISCNQSCGGEWTSLYAPVPTCEGTYSGPVVPLTTFEAPSFLLSALPVVHGRRLLFFSELFGWSERKTHNVLRAMPGGVGFVASLILPDDGDTAGAEALAQETEQLALTVADNSRNIAEIAAAQKRSLEIQSEIDSIQNQAISALGAESVEIKIAMASGFAAITRNVIFLQIGVSVARQENYFLETLSNNQEIYRIIATSGPIRKLARIASTYRQNPSLELPPSNSSYSYYLTSWGVSWPLVGGVRVGLSIFSKVTATRKRTMLSYALEEDHSSWTHQIEPLAIGLTPGECTGSASSCASDFIVQCYNNPQCYGIYDELDWNHLFPARIFNGSRCSGYPDRNPRVCNESGVVFSLDDPSSEIGRIALNARSLLVGPQVSTVWMRSGMIDPFLESMESLGGTSYEMEQEVSFGIRVMNLQLPAGFFPYRSSFHDPYYNGKKEIIPDFVSLPAAVKEMWQFGGDTDNVVYGILGPMIPITVGRVAGMGEPIVIDPLELTPHSRAILDMSSGVKPLTGWLRSTGCIHDSSRGICCSAESFGPLVENIELIKNGVDFLTPANFSPQALRSDISFLQNVTAGIQVLVDSSFNFSESQGRLDELGRQQDAVGERLQDVVNRSEVNALIAEGIAKRIAEIDFAQPSTDWWGIIALGVVGLLVICGVVWLLSRMSRGTLIQKL